MNKNDTVSSSTSKEKTDEESKIKKYIIKGIEIKNNIKL